MNQRNDWENKNWVFSNKKEIKKEKVSEREKNETRVQGKVKKATLFRSCSWVRRELFGSGGDGDG